MDDVDHTHPHTNDGFGEAFQRGPDIAADGGEREAAESTDSGTESETMAEIDHGSPTDVSNRYFERGPAERGDTE
jgi:hypothetical protein